MDDNIIALMGVTGTGKSSFIEKLTDQTGLAGHSLESFTEKISIIRFTSPVIVDSDICFVDTPGFDDTRGSDERTLKSISNFIIKTYRSRLKLTALFYFHRISDNRMTGSLVANLKHFEELCENDLNKVVFVTTMWDQVDRETGERHERELIDGFWNLMLGRGSSVKRFFYERSSAIDVLAPFFDEINTKCFRLLQEEIEGIKSKLLRSRDGQRLFDELKDAICRRQETLQTIRVELRNPSLPEGEIQKLVDNYEGEFENLSRIAAKLAALGIEKGRYFSRVVERMDWDKAMDLYSPCGIAVQNSVEENDVVPDREILEQSSDIVDLPDGAQGKATTNQPEKVASSLPPKKQKRKNGYHIAKPFEADQVGFWEQDDKLSDEDEGAIEPKREDDEEQEIQMVWTSDSEYARMGDVGGFPEFESESEIWEFELWKEEEERKAYERWYERKKSYEEFEIWTRCQPWGGDLEEGNEISTRVDDEEYDDWSLFEHWQEMEKRRKFDCLVDQEPPWRIWEEGLFER